MKFIFCLMIIILSVEAYADDFLGLTGRDGFLQKEVYNNLKGNDGIPQKFIDATIKPIRDHFKDDWEELKEQQKQEAIKKGEKYYENKWLVWDLDEEDDVITCRPVYRNTADKDLWIYDINKFIDYEIEGAGTIRSAFTNQLVPMYWIKYNVEKNQIPRTTVKD